MPDLDDRLRAVAHALDAEAPVLDPAVLRAGRPRGLRVTLVALAVAAALAAVAAAPAAVSALRDLFTVESVPELGPVPYGVAPAILGPQVPPETVRTAAPFHVATIPSLAPADAAYARQDVGGGMVTLAYGSILLTQWDASAVQAHVAVVPVSGTAEEVSVGSGRALWIAGTARGTLTLIGADGAVHRELFGVTEGSLLWEEDGVAMLLQGADPKAEAIRVAAEVSR
jgi:hypothetical protein